jgi:hypothetical protein
VQDMYTCLYLVYMHACLYLVCVHASAWVALACTHGIAHRELRTCATLSSQRSTYSLRGTAIHRRGIERAFAESIAANPDIALVDLQGVDLSLYMDVLGVSDELQSNCAILAHVQAQRIAQQRVKSARGGTR